MGMQSVGNACTVKLVYKTTLGTDKMVFRHRWSLYACLITWKVYARASVQCGLNKAGGLYIQVFFKTGLTIHDCMFVVITVWGEP